MVIGTAGSSRGGSTGACRTVALRRQVRLRGEAGDFGTLCATHSRSGRRRATAVSYPPVHERRVSRGFAWVRAARASGGFVATNSGQRMSLVGRLLPFSESQ